MDDIPAKILGYGIKTKLQICLNYLVPCIIELAVYVTVIVVDGALIYQHLLDENDSYAWISLGIICVPAILTFVIALIASEQYHNGAGQILRLIGIQILYLLTFPICATYRFSRKIFWCVESLFHEKNTTGRHLAICKAAETSQFELYHFLQSFFHCAPQIMFQMFIILRGDMFRNYDTAYVQVLSIIFGLIKMSMSAESYQRFESQKIVGKAYPWNPVKHKIKYMKSISAVEASSNRDENLATQASQNTNPQEENTKINDLDEEFDDDKKAINFNINITDDEKLNSCSNDILRPIDDDHDSRQKYNDNRSSYKEHLKHLTKPLDDTFHRISAMKNSFITHTESFIKEKIPRASETLFKHSKEEENAEEMKPFTQVSDSTDFFLPSKREVTAGIESDDLVAKFVAFLGWNFFLIMRLMSLSSFAVFHLNVCGWLCFFHYCLMILMLINETRFKVKWQRTAFYFVLAYIFIFNLIEFKVKFKKVRTWYVFYFIIVFIQNIAMTVSWYCFEDFLDSWWFEFIFLTIVQSGIMSLMCFLIYFFYLKPKDKIILS